MKILISFLFTVIFIFGTVEIPECGVLISGSVLDDRWFPVPEVTISISSGGMTTTDREGKFSIVTEKLPYSITVFDYANSNGVIYTNLSSRNIQLILFGTAGSRHTNTEVIRVDFPVISKNRSALIKFVSDNIFFSKDVTAFAGEKSKLITIEWPSKTNSINGRIMYLEKTQTSYEKYFERIITVYSGFAPQTVIFDSASFYSRPGSSSVTLYLPVLNYDMKSFSVCADFLSLHRNAEITLNNTEGNITSTKVLVPRNLSLGYRLKVEGKAYNKGGEGFENSLYTYPGSVLNLDSETPPSLESPQDKLYTVNDRTIFGYEWGSGTGIYVVNFHCFDPVGDFYIVTRDKQIYPPLTYASDILKGTEYSWKVYKYLTYFSVDDFVKEKIFSNDVGYRAILYSETRTFKTKPF